MLLTAQARSASQRRISRASIVCFSVSTIAFATFGLGLFINHSVATASLAINNLAAVGLIYLALGLLNLGSAGDSEASEVKPDPERTVMWSASTLCSTVSRTVAACEGNELASAVAPVTQTVVFRQSLLCGNEESDRIAESSSVGVSRTTTTTAVRSA